MNRYYLSPCQHPQQTQLIKLIASMQLLIEQTKKTNKQTKKQTNSPANSPSKPTLQIQSKHEVVDSQFEEKTQFQNQIVKKAKLT